jgi:cell division protein FtsL
MSAPARSIRPQAAPAPSRRPPAFWTLTAVLITGLVVGIVSLSALAVQASFGSDDLREQLGGLQQQQQVLREQVAAASAPSRVRRWARGEGMVMPDRVVILRIPPSEDSGA